MNTDHRDPLINVTSSIVRKLGSVGIFKYNKLTYLFEFFFIKNFGARYTGEYFCKLPHGPVIAEYKKQITALSKLEAIDTDISRLCQARQWGDSLGGSGLAIVPGADIDRFNIPERIVEQLLDQVIDKFGGISDRDLESAVYQTNPVKKYVELAQNRRITEYGGSILKNYSQINTYKQDPKVRGRLLALKHMQKFPMITRETQNKLDAELEDFIALRDQA